MKYILILATIILSILIQSARKGIFKDNLHLAMDFWDVKVNRFLVGHNSKVTIFHCLSPVYCKKEIKFQRKIHF